MVPDPATPDEPTKRLLDALRAHKDQIPPNIRQLAGLCGWSQNTTGKYVHGAKAAGWVQTRPVATAILVELTDAGRKASQKRPGAGGRL